MGEFADLLIEEEMFGREQFYPLKRRYVERTPSEKKIASIRKEIALLIKNGTGVQEARRLMNVKYGKGWRGRGLVRNSEDQWSESDLKDFI